MPDKTRNHTIRFPFDTYQALVLIAEREKRSINSQVIVMVEAYLTEHAPDIVDFIVKKDK